MADEKEPRITPGGRAIPRDVMNYQPPKGPININDPKTPGLHGTNHGCGQTHKATKGRG